MQFRGALQEVYLITSKRPEERAIDVLVQVLLTFKVVATFARECQKACAKTSLDRVKVCIHDQLQTGRVGALTATVLTVTQSRRSS